MSQAIEIPVQTDSNGDLIEPLVLGRSEILWCGHHSLDIDGVKQSVWITPKPNTEAHASAEVKDLQNQLKEFEAKYEQLRTIMTADRDKEVQKMNQKCIRLERQLAALIESSEVNAQDAKDFAERRRTYHRLQLIEVLEMTVKILQTE